MNSGWLREVARTQPLPIADAALNLMCAVTGGPYERAQRMAELLRATIRWCAGVALTVRLSADRMPSLEPPAVRDALDTLRKRGALTDGAWRGLARDLLAPWATQPDEHPLPALVRLFHDGRTKPKLGPRLDALIAFRNQMAHGSPATAAEVQALVDKHEPDLAAWLEALDPAVCALRLVLPLAASGGPRQRAYLLMGSTPARGRWLPEELAPGVIVPPGVAVLIDGDGRPVLALEPIVRVLRPSPDAPEEVFFLDGRGKRGSARYLSLPNAAEREEPQVWEILASRLGASSDDTAERRTDLPDEPFRGLESFEAQHARVFFGRERETRELADLVRREGMVTLTGPSGIGKTSLLRAGVGPALERRHAQIAALEHGEAGVPGHRAAARVPPRYAWIVLRPGAAPLASLASAIQRQLAHDGPLVAPDPPPATAAGWRDLLLAWARDQRRVLVLVVDQAEELVTHGATVAERDAFAELLAGLGASAEQPARVIVSVRGDYFARLAEIGPLYRRYDTHVYTLRAPGSDDLRRTLTEPLAAYQARFEAGLVDAMVDAAGATTSALPLLQFTAARLWEKRDERGTLTRAAYDELGGVEGALSRYADRVLDAQLVPELRATAERVFLALLTAEGTRVMLRDADLRARVAGSTAPDALDSVLETLTRARLLTSRAGPDGERQYDVVHERLAESWTRLATLRRAHVADAVRRDQRRDAAKVWRAHGRSHDLLWRGDPLAAHRAWAQTTTSGITDEERAFVDASERAERRARRARQLVILGIAALAVVALVMGLRARSRASQATAERDVATHLRARDLLRDDPTASIALLKQLPADFPAWDAVWSDAMDARSRGIARRIHTAPQGALRALALSETGDIVAYGGSETPDVHVWSARRDIRTRDVAHGPGILGVGLSNSGRRLLSIGTDLVTRVDDLVDGTQRTLPCTLSDSWATPEARSFLTIPPIALSPNGRFVACFADKEGAVFDAVTASPVHLFGTGLTDLRFAANAPVLAISAGNVVMTWSAVDDGVQTSPPASADIGRVDVSADGKRIAWHSGAGVGYWDVGTDRVVEYPRDGTLVIAFALSPDGTLVAVSTWDRQTHIIDLATGHANTVTTDDHVLDLRFSPRGDRLALAGGDSQVYIYNVADRLVVPLRGHRAPVWAVRFSADGRLLASTGWDGTVRVWKLDDVLPWRLPATGVVQFGIDATRIATADQRGRIVVWDLAGRRATAQLDTGGDVRYLRLADSVVFATGEAVGRWRGAGGAQTSTLPAGTRVWHVGPTRTIASAGRRLIAFNATGQPAFDLTPTGSDITAVALDSAASTIAIGDRDGHVVLLRADNGASRGALHSHHSTVEDRSAVTRIEFSCDGQLVGTGSVDGHAYISRVADRQVVATARHRSAVTDIAFSRDGHTAASAGDDKELHVFDLVAHTTTTLYGHTGPVASADFSPDGALLVSGSRDGTVRLWTLATDRWTIVARHNFEVRNVAFAGDSVVSLDREGHVYITRILPRAPAALRAWIHDVTDVTRH